MVDLRPIATKREHAEALEDAVPIHNFTLRQAVQ
jgi:hypothetical protein